MHVRASAISVLALLFAFSPVADTAQVAGAQEAGLQAEVRKEPAVGVSERTYPTLDGRMATASPARWRVVIDTGNSNENYITTTPSGRIVDFGGAFPHYSDDQGRTWYIVVARVPTASVVLGFEGAVTVAPNGDVLGVTWGGFDKVIAYKMVAATGTWWAGDIALHTPLFDRPGLAVVNGPIQVGTLTFPYAAILVGGWPLKEIQYISHDGLTYTAPTTANAMTELASAQGRIRSVPAIPAQMADWTQSNYHAHLSPLSGGGALGRAESGCERNLLRPDLSWQCLSWGLGSTGGVLVQDSGGWFHHARVESDASSGAQRVAYSLSTDGSTWLRYVYPLPPSHEVRQESFLDLKVNASVGVAAIALHSEHVGTGNNQDLVYKVVNGRLDRVYFVGSGNHRFGSHLLDDEPDRFDFTTVAILPSGKIVVSFADATYRTSSLAIEI